jgi:hypothetical protein
VSAMIRGRSTSIVAADTDTSVVTVPTGKELLVTRLMVSNNNPAAARVRVFDHFTESDGTVHDSTTNPVVLFDRNLLAGESIDLVERHGLATALGAVVARSSVAGADPDDVAVGVWGRFQ